MESKKVRIVITCESRQKALEEAKKWVLQLEKEIQEERRNCRTRGLILLGNALLGAIADEDTKFKIFEQFIEMDAVLKNKKSTVESKKAAKEKANKTVLGLAKTLQDKLRREAASADQAASQASTVPPSETKQS